MAVTKTKLSKPQNLKPQKEKQYYTCCRCGTDYAAQRNNFPVTKSEWYSGNKYYLPICRKCFVDMYNHYVSAYGGKEEKAIKRMCMAWDLFYSEDLFRGTLNDAIAASRATSYLGKLNFAKDKTYDDYLVTEKQFAVFGSNDTSSDNDGITKEVVDFWGRGYDQDDYIFLQSHYQNLITRHECKTAAQEILFKRIAKAELQCEKADLTNDTKKIKEANDTLQSLMGSANVKPNQTNSNNLAETNTFGTLIQKWEEHDPIPEPDPAWADVDGIGKYFRVWVLGPLMRMFGLKNPFEEEFEEEFERYSAKKPDYTDGDSVDSDIRRRIFGGAEGGA